LTAKGGERKRRLGRVDGRPINQEAKSLNTIIAAQHLLGPNDAQETFGKKKGRRGRIIKEKYSKGLRRSIPTQSVN